LAFYASHANPAHYQPSNITFGIMEPIDVRSARGPADKSRGGSARQMSKVDKKLAIADRALQDLTVWLREAAA
jgi:folate-dependent tRNA-U54 methylase TrmFO/GidA